MMCTSKSVCMVVGLFMVKLKLNCYILEFLWNKCQMILEIVID